MWWRPANGAMPATDERVRLALHPGQAAVWRSKARFRVVVAGRRWGKTQLARAWLLDGALRQGPGRYWYVAPTFGDAEDIMWTDLKAACDPSWIADKSETDLSVTLKTGAVIRLWSAEKGDGLRGRPLRRLVLDEYADMDADLWSEILRPSLADYRAPAIFIGTPKSFNHFYDLFQRGQSGVTNWASWQYRSVENPFLDPEEIEEAKRTTDPRSFRQEWEASFETIAGRAYYAFQRATHVQSVALQPQVPVAVSFDFNIEPATAVIGQRIGDEVRVWREVWVAHSGGEATRASATAARALLRQAGWHGPIDIYGDPAGTARKTTGPSDHAVVREVFPQATWHIRGRAPHVRDRIAAVNGRLETMDGRAHLVIDPSCIHLIADLEQVTFAGNGDLDKSNPMLTHISDAMGYWVERQFPARQVVAIQSAWMERFA